jgi:hypothetical protein
MKYIKPFHKINENASSIYGHYSIANIHNVPEILNLLEESDIHYKYDEYSNFIDIEFCDGFVGDAQRKAVLSEIISSNRCENIGFDDKDDCLCIRPMKFY